MAPALLVFDLDGTLIHSQLDLANSVNAMLLHYGKDTLPVPVVAGYIGDGAGVLVRRALAHAHLVADQPDPHDVAFVDRALEWFVRYYREHKVDHTTLYPGVVEALERIRSAHPALPMAVLTNKPVVPSREICEHFGLNRFFFQIYGGNSFATKKPDPEGLRTLIAEATIRTSRTIRAEETVMIGDSHVDVETGRAAGTLVLGCSFGLSPKSLAEAGPDKTVAAAEEWPGALGLG